MQNNTYNKNPYNLFFRTLANGKRFAILNALTQRPKTVTEICTATKCNQTTISHHLNTLKTCSFVFMKKNGKQRRYSLNAKTIKPLLGLIDKHTKTYCQHLCGRE